MLAQSQLAAVLLHAMIQRNTEFDLWPMEFGITPTLSTATIDSISDLHIKALLFELNFIRLDVKSHSLIVTTRDTFMNIAICLADYDVDFEVNVNPIRQHHNTERFNVKTFIIHTKDIQKQEANGEFKKTKEKKR